MVKYGAETRVDPKTGEVKDGRWLWHESRAKLREPWAMLMLETITALASDKRLRGEDWRVLLSLVGSVDFENWVRIPQSQIAERLGMRRPHVSRAMTRLVDLGLLVKGPKADGLQSYRFNSQFVWRGKTKNLNRHRIAVQEPKLRLIQGGAPDASA